MSIDGLLAQIITTLDGVGILSLMPWLFGAAFLVFLWSRLTGDSEE